MPDFIDQKIEEEIRSGRLTKERANRIIRVCLVLPAEQRAELAGVLMQAPELFSVFVDNLEKKMRAVASDDMGAWRAIIEEEVRQIDTIT